MQRIPAKERPNLARAALEHGFEFDAVHGIPYWDESAYYRFSLRQIEDDLKGQAEEIENMCFAVVERASKDEEVLRCLGIAEVDLVRPRPPGGFEEQLGECGGIRSQEMVCCDFPLWVDNAEIGAVLPDLAAGGELEVSVLLLGPGGVRRSHVGRNTASPVRVPPGLREGERGKEQAESDEWLAVDG